MKADLIAVARTLASKRPKGFQLTPSQFTADFGPGPDVVFWIQADGLVLTNDFSALEALTSLAEDEGWGWSVHGSGFGSSRRTFQLFDRHADLIGTGEDPDPITAALIAFGEAFGTLEAVNA